MNHEPRDASLPIIGTAAVIIAGLIALAIGVSTWVYVAHYGRQDAVRASPRQSWFGNGPTARPAIAVDRAKVMQSAEQHLNGYAWVDRQQDVARIPIDRAMRLLVVGAQPAPVPKPPGQVP